MNLTARRKLWKRLALVGALLILGTIWVVFAWGMNPATHDPFAAADRACMDVPRSEYVSCREATMDQVSEPIIPWAAVPAILASGALLMTTWPVTALLERRKRRTSHDHDHQLKAQS